MTSLGFENYAEVLKVYLAKYRQVILFSFLGDVDVQSNKDAPPTGGPGKRKGSSAEGMEEDDILEEEEEEAGEQQLRIICSFDNSGNFLFRNRSTEVRTG